MSGQHPPGQTPPAHWVKKQPKYCRCRVCHEHFYGETIAEAHRACVAHAEQTHPDWGDSSCYCPD
jgi:uncharacterized protein YqfB (UPF0267 family)